MLIQARIEDLIKEAGTDFNLLLSHRAELMSVYAAANVDLTLTGHAHGGRFVCHSSMDSLPLLKVFFLNIPAGSIVKTMPT
ncbi:MAG: hypothetical protein LRY37_01155 [Alkalibacterium thalassium]|nr:hypothetical protein [Alkalibacterium thalassium]